MPEKASFAALPAEVFELIAEEADPADLFAVRLVNKEAAGKVFNTYLRKQFGTVKVLLASKHSLEAARSIVQHPVFGKQIHKVIVFVDDLYTQDIFGIPIVAPAHGGEASGLRDIFNMLGAKAKNLQLTYSGGHGPLHTQPREDTSFLDKRALDDVSPLGTALNAVGAAKLTELSTEGWCFQCDRLIRSTTDLRSPDKYHIENRLRTIESLHLHLWSDLYGAYETDQFFKIIARMRGLRHLTICGKDAPEEVKFDPPNLGEFFGQKFSCLQRFEMRQCGVQTFPALREFLVKNDTVQELLIEDTEIEMFDWSRFCDLDQNFPEDLLEEVTSIKAVELAGSAGFRIQEELGQPNGICLDATMYQVARRRSDE